MRKFRFIIIALILTLAISLLGCGSEENTDQLAYRTYGINCLNSGQYEEAATAFQAGLDCSNHIGEVEVDLCLYKAKAQALSGDSAGALDTYTALLAVKKIPAAYLQRGNLYLATGQKDLALADYHSAVEKAGKDYELYLSVYDSLAAYGDDAEAEEFLQDAGSISGKSVKDSYYRGRFALLSEDYDTAKSELEKAADGGMAEAYFYLGKVYSAQGDSTTAMSYYQAYTASENATPDALRDLGLEELEAGNDTEAITLLETARTITEEPDGALLQGLAVAYEHILDFDDAYLVLQEYCQAFPDDADAARELTFLETRKSDAEASESDGAETDSEEDAEADATEESAGDDGDTPSEEQAAE